MNITTPDDDESMPGPRSRFQIAKEHKLRQLHIKLGDIYQRLARAIIDETEDSLSCYRDVMKYVILSIDQFQAAGLSWKAQAVHRWGEWLRRAWRRAGGEE